MTLVRYVGPMCGRRLKPPNPGPTLVVPFLGGTTYKIGRMVPLLASMSKGRAPGASIIHRESETPLKREGKQADFQGGNCKRCIGGSSLFLRSH